MSHLPIKRALISVSNKEGIIPLAQQLHQLGVEIISTGGSGSLLRAEKIPVLDVADVTGFPEIMEGRIKTLHPKIHGGILGKRQHHVEIAKKHQLSWIDLVIVNLYPFSEVIQKPDTSVDLAIENIDIGGPAMIRSAAKNMAYVAVVVDPGDYEWIGVQLKEKQGLHLTQRQALAQKAFAHTAQYDALIHHYLTTVLSKQSPFPLHQQLSLTKVVDLRYGENPNQKACAYRLNHNSSSILDATQHQGKTLSYNNIVDTHAAMACVREFKSPACVIVKHANPCGVAIAHSGKAAFMKALAADSTAAFGGIIALNQICDLETAAAITETFFEVLIAPGFTKNALQQLAIKPNLRVLERSESNAKNGLDYQFIEGLVLAQETNQHTLQPNQIKVVTQKTPSADEIDHLIFAWNVVKHVKSNAIVVSKNNRTVGIGPGQVSRVDAVKMALQKAGREAHQASLASDAFFPFHDSIHHMAQAGISAIIQPGGSIRDEEVIESCDEHGIAMVLTGTRCFKH